jgi:hypothetical protein
MSVSSSTFLSAVAAHSPATTGLTDHFDLHWLAVVFRAFKTFWIERKFRRRRTSLARGRMKTAQESQKGSVVRNFWSAANV